MFQKIARRLYRKLSSIYNVFYQNKGGNFAIFFGFLLIPLVIAIGIIVDISNQNSRIAFAQNAADIAALHGARIAASGKSTLQKEARIQFDANLEKEAGSYSIKKFDAQETGTGTVKVTVDGVAKPYFMTVFGYPKLNFQVVAEASTAQAGGAEIVIVLDATQSMGFTDARESTVDEIKGALDAIFSGGGAASRVSFIPFTDRVNIGKSRSAFLSSSPPADWEGCTEPRYEPTGSYPYLLTDTSPSVMPFDFTPKDYLPPYFIERTSKIDCPTEIVVGASNKTAIFNILDTYKKKGTGRPDMALAWAWRLVSPKWKNKWGISNFPKEYKDASKHIVYVTDGNARLYCEEANSYYPKRPPELDGNSICKNQVSNEVFSNIVKMCTDMKAGGIQLHVMYVDGLTRGEPFMQKCASKNSYYDVENKNDIVKAVKSIFGNMSNSNLKLVK